MGGLRAKILDFGLARLQTKHAMPLGGTLQWKAPEVIRNRQGTPAPSADVFSFGLFAYFCVTGLKPFPGLTHSAIKQLRRRGQNMPRLWPVSVALVEECRALCAGCLLPDPGARPSAERVFTDVLAWRPLRGTSSGHLGGRSGGRSWDEQVQRLRRSLSGQIPTPGEVDGDAAIPLVPAPTQRLLHPAFRATPVASKRLTLTSMLAQWNVPFPEDSCCLFHAVLREALEVVQELQTEGCSDGNNATADFQCPRCGLMDTLEGVGECGMCKWMAAVDPRYADGGPRAPARASEDHLVLSL